MIPPAVLTNSWGFCYTQYMKPVWVIGIDEVGRGPLAGPVYVCGIAMKMSEYKKMKWRGLTDSKKMTSGARESWHALAHELQLENKIKIALASQSAINIDRHGINPSISKCIEAILSELKLDPKKVLVLLDGGLKAPKKYTHQQTIIRGDSKKKIISLASVVAKVTRDNEMEKVGGKYPLYKWGANKGYGTKAHIEAIKEYGITPLHRRSYLSRILDKRYK